MFFVGQLSPDGCIVNLVPKGFKSILEGENVADYQAQRSAGARWLVLKAVSEVKGEVKLERKEL